MGSWRTSWWGRVLTFRGRSRAAKVGVCALLGVLLGLAVVIVRISNAASYLSDEPATCMNCHVMTDAYVSWQRGSHRRVAGCNDCHVPQSNPLAGWAFKASDGLRHSAVFTARAEPQVLRLNPAAVPVIQANCVRCHAEQLTMIRLAGADERVCWDCHTNVHGEAGSLSASPRELRPPLPRAGLRLPRPDGRGPVHGPAGRPR